MHQTVKRVLWMVGLWAGSIIALGMVSSLFRLLMNAAGLTH